MVKTSPNTNNFNDFLFPWKNKQTTKRQTDKQSQQQQNKRRNKKRRKIPLPGFSLRRYVVTRYTPLRVSLTTLVYCSLSLPIEQTSSAFIRPTCLTFSLNMKFKATLTYDSLDQCIHKSRSQSRKISTPTISKIGSMICCFAVEDI